MSKLLNSVRIKAKLLQKAKIKSNHDFKLKDAYEILAKTSGYSSWREWKEILEEHTLYTPDGAAIWHVWYSDYEEALTHLNQKSGLYLIPSQKHFFICDENYLVTLGIQTDNADLLEVGNNWFRPKDFEAWKKLLTLMKKNKLK